MKKIKELYLKYKEIINYIIFGVLTTIVNFFVYFLLTKLLVIDEIISNIISWFVSVLFAYITNKIFVFESQKSGFKDIIIEMTSFFLARVFSGICCDIGTFALMIKVFNINDTIAKIVTQIMVIILNYLLSKLLIFKKSKAK